MMLQSSRPPETIQTELEAFLQDQSGPFTKWLCEKLAKIANEGGSKRRRREKRAEDGEKTKEKKAKKEKKAAAQAAQAAAQTAPAATPNVAPTRSRSRKRRRRVAATPVTVTTSAPNQTDRKAKLTPNVDYMHEGRPQKSDGREAPAPAGDTRWSFRADPSGHPPPSHPHHELGSPYYQTSPYPSRMPHAPVAAPQYFTPKKWKVARGNTVVRKSERLDSEEVQKLQEGEIVEQVAPAFTTENGIIRVQIRHPSSPLFPKPIGWVTQDATAAGGPKFLEPGPEPMQRTQPATAPGPPGWRPPASPWGAWRPRPGVPPPRPAANYTRPGFQNLTWTPN